MPELWNAVTNETTFNGKPLGDRMGRVTFKPHQQLLMAQYIVRYGLIPSTAKSGGNPAELFAMMGSVGPLHTRYIHHRIADAVERRARKFWDDDQYRPSHVRTEKRGRSAVEEVWRYPEFMQRWLDADWDGDQVAPKEDDGDDDGGIVINGDDQQDEGPGARGSGQITPPTTPARRPPRQITPPPPPGPPPPPPTPVRTPPPPPHFSLPRPIGTHHFVPRPPVPRLPFQPSAISTYSALLRQLQTARGDLHDLFLRRFRGEPLQNSIRRAAVRINEMQEQLVDLGRTVAAESRRARLAARAAVLGRAMDERVRQAILRLDIWDRDLEGALSLAIL